VRGTSLIARSQGEPAPIEIALTRVPELNRLDYEERDGLLIGAALPLGGVLEFPPVRDAYAILADGGRPAGPGEAWARATFAELLGNGPPAADLVVPLICLGASVAVFGPHGWSEMAVEALCVKREGAGLQPGEFIVDVRLPARSPRSGGAYVRSDPQGDAMGVGAFLLMQDDLDTCCGARLTVWLAPGTAFRALDAERFLRGKRFDDDLVRRAGELIAEAGGPLPDQSDRVEERLHGLREIACQAIHGALDRARSHPGG
ncbi:MAG TPA: FAD binding domain-containing protein, partial [Candidatus Methylomirabilis sp.]